LSGILLPITEVRSSIFPLYHNHVIRIMAISTSMADVRIEEKTDKSFK